MIVKTEVLKASLDELDTLQEQMNVIVNNKEVAWQVLGQPQVLADHIVFTFLLIEEEEDDEVDDPSRLVSPPDSGVILN